MHTLYKQNGQEVKVNDNSLSFALSLGWSKKPPAKASAKKPAKKAK